MSLAQLQWGWRVLCKENIKIHLSRYYTVQAMVVEPQEFRRPNVEDDELRTVTDLLQFHAHHNPKHVFCIQAQGEERSEAAKLIAITYEKLLILVYNCCRHLNLGAVEAIPENDLDVQASPRVALLMDNDVMILIYLFAFLSKNITVLLLSPRLTSEGISALMKQLEIERILVSKRFRHLAEAAINLQSPSMDEPRIEVPSTLAGLLAATDERPINNGTNSIPMDRPLSHEDKRGVLILHSSGTTGMPKPIPCSHSWLLNFINCHELSPSQSKNPMVSTLPLFHGYGFVAPFVSMGSGKAFCLPPAGASITADSIIDLIDASQASALITVPSILEEIATSRDDAIQKLSPLEFVATGGGNLNYAIAKNLSGSGIALLNHFGATECGPLAPIFVPDQDYDWEYFRLRKDIKFALKAFPSSADADGTCRQLTLYPPGWDSPFVLQDKLVQRSLVSNEFKVLGRADDLLVLASGEKIFPGPIEESIMRSPLISRAVLFGSGQFEVGLLIKPGREIENEEEFRDLVWDVIAAANRSVDGFARIASKHHLLLVAPSTTFPLTDKGTLRRKDTYVQFQKEIDSLYTSLDHGFTADVDIYCGEDLSERIKQSVQQCPGWLIPEHQWTVDDNLFELGVDSLQILQLSRAIAKYSAQSSATIRKLIFQQPCVRKLAVELNRPNNETRIPIVSDQIAGYVALYSKFNFSPNKLAGMVVLITGGTGNIGCHLVASLLKHPEVFKVICLNRFKRGASQTALERQTVALAEAGYVTEAGFASKLQVYESSTFKERLGLSHYDYDGLSSSVTHIMHAAWPMSFSQGLVSYESQFQTLRNLIILSERVHNLSPSIRPRLIFISSIATVGKFPTSRQGQAIPEVPVVSDRFTIGTGYGNAKLVCEKIVEMARAQLSDVLEISYIRLGQIVGSRSGKWNQSEHLPTLIKTSQQLGYLPDLHGTLSWLPVEVAVSGLTDILLSKQRLPLVMHMENHNRIEFRTFSKIACEALRLKEASQKNLQEWVSDAISLINSPLEGLEDFFKHDFERMAAGSISLDTSNSLAISSSLREYGLTGLETLPSSVAYWKSTSFLT